MPRRSPAPSLVVMNTRLRRKLLLSLLFAGLIAIAVAAWVVQGVRYALGGGRELSPAS